MNYLKFNKKNTGNLLVYLLIIFVILIAIITFYIINNKKSENNVNINDNKTNQTNNENIDTNSMQNDTSYYNFSKNNDNDNDDSSSININNVPINEKKEVEIASYSTTIYDTDQNRIDNIKLATEKLNNKIVKKDEEFSFNTTIGPMDSSNGFKEALGFDSDGNKIKIFGGGICQLSSTLYNCTLDANMNITERHPHSRRVYYVPENKDATILYGTLDFKFINNRSNDIKILSTSDGSTVTVKLIEIT